MGASIRYLLHALGQHIADGGDDALSPQSHHIHRSRIIPREHREALRSPLDDAGYLIQVPGGFLDCHDVLTIPSQAQGGVSAHVDGTPAGDVIQDDGQVSGCGYGLEVLVEPFLGRLVVIGHDAHEGIHTQRSDIGGELHRIRRTVVPHVRDDGHPSRNGLYHRVEELQLLGIEDRRRLTRGAIDHQGIAPALDEPISELCCSRKVKLQIRGERSDHGWNHAAEARVWVCHLIFLWVRALHEANRGSSFANPF